MKKLLIASFITLCASLTYAGPSCGGCSGGDKDKTDSKTGLTESSIIVAGSCSGGGCGEKGDKGESKTGSSAFESTTAIAGSGCGAGGCGDKKGGDVTPKEGRSLGFQSVA